MTYIDFRNAIGFKESSNRYTVVNPLGYLGRYQFGTSRLSDFGLCVRKVGTVGFGNADFEWVAPFTQDDFLASPALQDACFDIHVWRFQEQVLSHFSSQMGKEVGGVLCTLSGCVACCHLLGFGGLVSFFKGVVQKDANGMRSVDYIKLFGGYEHLTVCPNSGINYLKTLIQVASPLPKLTFWQEFKLVLKSLI